MPNTRGISDRRPTVILAVLVVLCLASLASGTRGSMVTNGVRTVASVAGYPFIMALNLGQNAFDYSTGMVVEYDALRERTGMMEQRLGEAMQRLAAHQELEAENERLRRMLDFERAEPQFGMIAVEIIQRDRNGMMTIDRGSVHGIRESMCVITSKGVVGMVAQVEPLTAHVITLQNTDCRVDAMIRRNRVRGTIHGSGNDLSRICTMHYIDLKDDVREGDVVVTSPDSVFPSGLPVGRVSHVEQNKGPLAKAAHLMPAVDPFRVDEVFVLESADTPWRDMAGNHETDAAPDSPEPLLDMQTIQERYAP